MTRPHGESGERSGYPTPLKPQRAQLGDENGVAENLLLAQVITRTQHRHQTIEVIVVLTGIRSKSVEGFELAAASVLAGGLVSIIGVAGGTFRGGAHCARKRAGCL
jgi:hypothetical protein